MFYEGFNDSFLNDVKDLQWSEVCQENDVNALKHLMDKLVKLV